MKTKDISYSSLRLFDTNSPAQHANIIHTQKRQTSKQKAADDILSLSKNRQMEATYSIKHGILAVNSQC